MDQSSIYYWFKNKDDILLALLARTVERNRGMIERLAEVLPRDGEEDLFICAMAYAATYVMCDLPYEFREVEALSLRRPDDVKSYLKDYGRTYRTVGRAIERGIRRGIFRVDSPEMAAEFFFAQVEGAQHRHHLRCLNAWEDTFTYVRSFAFERIPTKSDEARLAATTICLALCTERNVVRLFRELALRGWLECESHIELSLYYGKRTFEFGRESLCKMTLPDNLEGLTVLDAGCRRGKGAYKISQMVGPTGRVIGTNWNAEYIREAQAGVPRALERSGFAESNMEFSVVFPEDLHWAGIEDGTVDVVYANTALNLTFEPREVVNEFYRVLKPGGLLIQGLVVAEGEVSEPVVRAARRIGNCVQAAPSRKQAFEAFRDAGFQEPEIVESYPVRPDQGSRDGYRVPTVDFAEDAVFYEEVLHLRKPAE